MAGHSHRQRNIPLIERQGLNSMKKSFILAILALTSAVYCAENLVKNGDFSKVTADGKAENWTAWPQKLAAGVKVEVDKNTGHNDDQSMVISNPAKKYYTRIDQLNIPVKPNTKYMFRVFIKGMNLEHSKKCGSARVFIGANGKVDKPVALVGPGLQRGKEKAVDPWSFDWREYKTTFNSKKNTSIGLSIYLHFTQGTIWIDDVELVEVK